ncbi:Hansenula MRAKII killer toxin-resistant protein 1 [Actinoplanes sp. NPDC026619]|uniref:Hansenula MRAKII killer toxin-resistant protein 1 n=1 Tax=Actinoplanes sp. NPDC026619 TaxID=3155798 RepID=UPI0033DE8D51
MADKGWTARIATAAGVAAGTGAAQLGLGYGLGVVVWPVATTPDSSVWLGSLGWATWITASATVFGAVIASRAGDSDRPRGPLAAIFAISAGVGALVAVALIALPARDAVRLEAHTPQAIAAAYALIGVVLGVLVAYWAVRSRPVGANLIATAVWLWALAITAIVVELSLHRDSATYLTSWQFSEATSGGRYGTIYWPSALLTLGAAFLIGILAAAPAAARGEFGVSASTSGAVGPLLVAASFLVLAPRLTGDLGPLESAYLIAPYAVLAGLAGSTITVAAAKSMADRRTAINEFAVAADPQTSRRDATTEPAFADSQTGSRDVTAEPAVADLQTGRRDAADEPAVGTKSRSFLRGRSVGKAAVGLRSDRRDDPSDLPANVADEPARADRAKLPAQSQPAAPTPAPAAPPAKAQTPAPTPAAGAAPRRDGRPSPTPVGQAKKPTPVNDPPKAPNVAPDPEIAAAARPSRGRKATQPAKGPARQETKSTVTPPPHVPTIAQINPKPSSND